MLRYYSFGDVAVGGVDETHGITTVKPCILNYNKSLPFDVTTFKALIHFHITHPFFL
jgi:hypothetical protein